MKIISYPRLHITLVDLAGVTHRRFGGAGIAIDGLPTVVHVERSRRPYVHSDIALDDGTLAVVRSILERVRPICGGVAITVTAAPPQHIGLGSKTALAMAIAAGAFRVWKYTANRDAIQTLSGRGGASGVGIHTFFDGGFIADGGHIRQPAGAPFRPSSATSGHSPPPALVRVSVPRSWRFTLLLPKGRCYSGTDERLFFDTYTPISSAAALRTLALVYHGIAPAVASDDLPLMRRALQEIQQTGFKRLELRGQPTSVRRVLRSLQAKSVPAGMSSMGPLIYAITSDVDGVDRIREVAKEYDTSVLGTFQARRKGYEISHG